MKIDIWSDVVCPWCYVGKRNLEEALGQLGIHPDIQWRAFELDPSAPTTTGKSMAEVLAAKFGVSVEQAQEMNAQMTATAAKVGLTYDLDTAKMGSSFDAHRLAKLAEEQGKGSEAAEALFAAYFTNGQRLSDPDTLIAIGSSLGLAEESIRDMLGSDQFADAVRADEALAQDAGFTGVPTMVIDGRFAIPGAQPPDVLVRLISKLLEDDQPA